MRTVQAEGFAPLTDLTVSGGLTPSVTGLAIDLSKCDGNLSLILVNGGASTSLTVTYEFGYILRANAMSKTVTWITPEGGGTIANLTTVNIAAADIHEAITVDPITHIRFICANADAINTATVSLYVIFQNSGY